MKTQSQIGFELVTSTDQGIRDIDKILTKL